MFETFAFAFVTLFVTVGPIELAGVFALLTEGKRLYERPRLARRSVIIAGAVLLLFALGGNRLLSFLEISLPAFRFAGGILLLLQAIDLVLAHPTSISSITSREEREAEQANDISVFPLAIPLIAGPGSMTATVLLISRAGADTFKLVVVLVTLAVVLFVTYLSLRMVEPMQRILGHTGANVVARVSGILLAALAVQFLFDGIRAAHLLD